MRVITVTLPLIRTLVYTYQPIPSTTHQILPMSAYTYNYKNIDVYLTVISANNS